jgi:membrane protease YdiL (CAAX protease family)
MPRVVLSLALLAFSGYVWPSFYKRSTTVGELLMYVAIGLVMVVGLGVLARTIDRKNACEAQPRPRGIQLLIRFLWCVPIAVLQVAFALAYWANVGGGQMHLGALSALTFTFMLLWAIVDAAIRGVCEESVFRGMLQPALQRAFAHHTNPTVSAIALTTLCFVIAHLYGVPDLRLLPYFAVLSVWYGYLSSSTGSFVGSAALHVMHNIGAALVGYFELSDWGNHAGVIGMLALLFANSFAILALAKRWPQPR